MYIYTHITIYIYINVYRPQCLGRDKNQRRLTRQWPHTQHLHLLRTYARNSQFPCLSLQDLHKSVASVRKPT